MTALQLAIVAGSLCGLGVALVLWQLVPAQPDLPSALARLAPERRRQLADDQPAPAGDGLQDRAGVWVHKHLPATAAGWLPRRELAVLRVPVHRYLGEKALLAGVGLLFPPLANLVLALLGISLPWALPVIGGLLLAVVLSFIPDLNVRGAANDAREEFARALGAYIDLVALERAGSAGATQALEVAARVGDSWVFRRLREELARARWSGVAPWDGLAALADELGLPELADLGDIMRLSGEQEAAVYATLRARAASLRNAMLTDEQARANAVNERMSMPVAALGLVFLVLLAMPAVLRVAA